MGKKARANSPRPDVGQSALSEAKADARSQLLGTASFLNLVIENIPAMVAVKEARRKSAE